MTLSQIQQNNSYLEFNLTNVVFRGAQVHRHPDYSEPYCKHNGYKGRYSLLPSASAFSEILNANAAIVNDGLTPREDGRIDPSTT